MLSYSWQPGFCKLSQQGFGSDAQVDFSTENKFSSRPCQTKKLLHPSLVFNNAEVTQSIYQKHLGTILDSKLTFESHLKMVTTKILFILVVTIK